MPSMSQNCYTISVAQLYSRSFLLLVPHKGDPPASHTACLLGDRVALMGFLCRAVQPYQIPWYIRIFSNDKAFS